jgi:hypothetical protein
MRESHPRSARRWTRAVAVIGLLLTLQVPAPAHAECTAPEAPSSTTRPLPPPGTCRLIRIGPQMVLQQDSTGRLTIADEPPPKRSRGRNAAAFFVGLLSAAALLTLGRNDARVSGRVGAR